MSIMMKGETDLQDKFTEYCDKRASMQKDYRVARWGTYWDADIALITLAAALIGSMVLPFYMGFIIGGLVGYTLIIDIKGKNVRREMNNRFSQLNEGSVKDIAGMVGEDTVTSILKQFDVLILNDVKISFNPQKKPSQIDHIAVCPFGILCIETKNLKGGDYCTSASDPDVWSGGHREFYSPQKQAIGHAEILAKKLKVSGLRNAAELVKPIVVLANNNCRYTNESTSYSDVSVFSAVGLADYIKKEIRKPAVLRPEVQRRIGSMIKLLCEK